RANARLPLEPLPARPDLVLARARGRPRELPGPGGAARGSGGARAGRSGHDRAPLDPAHALRRAVRGLGPARGAGSVSAPVIKDSGERALLPPFTEEHEELRETIRRWVE